MVEALLIAGWCFAVLVTVIIVARIAREDLRRKKYKY